MQRRFLQSFTALALTGPVLILPDLAAAQVITTTTTTTAPFTPAAGTVFCTGPGVPAGCFVAPATPGPVSASAFGANTGNIVAKSIGTQIEADLEDRRQLRQQRRSNRLPTKAPPLESDTETVAWASGAFNYERRSGIVNGNDVGLRTHGLTGMLGLEWTRTLSADVYLTYGLFGGTSHTWLRAPTGAIGTVDAPTIGAYLEYSNGGFSAGLSYSTSFMRNQSSDVTSVMTSVVAGPASCGGCTALATTTITSTALSTVERTHELEGNLHYRFDLANRWWIEPTAGFVWLYEVESAGISDLSVFRLQGGARIGTTWNWGGIKVEPSLAGLVYSDVSVTGGIMPNGVALTNDQGLIWGKGIGKLKFIWSDKLETSLQGEIYGTSGVQDVIGYKAMAELRYKW